MHYFGPISDPGAAFDTYLAQASRLMNQPEAKTNGRLLTLQAMGDAYLRWNERREAGGELSVYAVRTLRVAVAGFLESIGPRRRVATITAEDFSDHRAGLVSRLRPGSVGTYVSLIRAMFRFAYDTGLLDEMPRWGPTYRMPSGATMTRARYQREAEHGKPIFTIPEVHRLVAYPASQRYFRPCVWLGLNAAFGQADCAGLEFGHLDLDRAVIDFPRPKTLAPRVAPLWPETVAAIREWLRYRGTGQRGDPVFLTPGARPIKTPSGDLLGNAFTQVLKRLKIERPRLGFYGLRKLFRTLADETNDQHAIHRIMGHTFPGMSGVYVQEISIDRLRAVTDRVRTKLIAQPLSTCLSQLSPSSQQVASELGRS